MVYDSKSSKCVEKANRDLVQYNFMYHFATTYEKSNGTIPKICLAKRRIKFHIVFHSRPKFIKFEAITNYSVHISEYFLNKSYKLKGLMLSYLNY